MEFWILGPLEVTSGDRRVELGYTKQQVVLGALLLYANRVVSRERLIDELWGESPPPSAAKLIQGYVSGLRRVLGRDAIVTRSGGYLVRVDPERLDAARFERLVGEGLACRDNPELAAKRLGSALGLWRGSPLAGLPLRSSARHELARLAEQRLTALERRVDAELRLGRHHELVGELRELVAMHAYREHLRGQLMLALYRSGRQAEALDVYRAGRRLLADQLALEPSAPLRDLERQILRHDPVLRLAPRARSRAAPSASRPPTSARARERRRMLLAAAVAGLVATAVAVPVLFGGGGDGGRPGGPAGNSVGVLDPQSGRLLADVALRMAPGDVAVGGGAVWVANPNEGAITRIEPTTRTIRQTIRVRTGPAAIAVGARAVWVANGLDGTVSKVSPDTNRVVQTTRVGNGPTGVAVGEGSVWVVNRDDHTLSRIDPAAGRVRTTVAAGADPVDVAAGAGAIWVTSRSDGELLKLNPATGRIVDAVSVGRGPAAAVVAGGSVWVANALDGTVSRVDPVGAVVRGTVPVGQGPTALAAGLGGVWVGHEGDGSVWRIDPATGAVARPLPLGRPVAGLGAGAGALFVSALPAGSPHRGGTLRVLFGGDAIESVDPGSAYDPVSLSVLRLTHDGLTAFERVAGSGGAQLVPNLATSLPKPTDAGRTYTFRVRDGIRYANGDPVRPADFQRALERVFTSRSGAASLYTALEGARACARRPRRCDLSAGVAPDGPAGTVTFHLTEPDPELPNKLALPPAAPVPPDALSRASRGRPVTGTGAYTIASYVPGRELKLVRNPHFRQWSWAARPAGYPDEIVFALGVSDARQLRDVARGDADVAYFPPARKLAPLRSRYATRLHTNPGPALWYLGLNTHVRPFDDVRVRRALNYAVDRTTVARSSGGAFGARPTCQILPLGLPGHRPYCPYHHDLARARRLVAASGTRGARVVVWSSPRALAWMSPIISALRQLGYRARIRFAGEDDPSITALPRRVIIQAAQQARVAEYPAASSMVHPFTCRARTPNLPSFCDHAIDHAIYRALKLQPSDPHAASDLWARIDSIIVDRAAAVPLANPRRIDFLSKRVGNYQYHPLWGMLLDQLWVR